MNITDAQIQKSPEKAENTFHYLAFFSRLIKYWYLFLLSLAGMLLVALYYIKYNQSLYETTTTLLIKNEISSGGSKRYSGIKEVTDLYNESQNIGNEKIIIESYSTIKKTIKQLDWKVSYFEKSKYTIDEIYGDIPICVNIDTSHIQLYGAKFYVEILSPEKYNLYTNGEKLKFVKKYKFGEIVESPSYKFLITYTDISILKSFINRKIFFTINDLNQLALNYVGNVRADIVDKKVSVMSISLRGNNVFKSVDFLNNLTKVYIDYKLSQKNQIAVNTINFINELLNEISDSLTFAENKLKLFKIDNRMMDIGDKSKEVFGQMIKFADRKSELIIKNKYCQYLKDIIDKNKDLNEIITPSAFGINDGLTNTMVSELIRLYTQKSLLSFSSRQSDQLLVSLDNKISTAKKMLLDNINYNLQVNEIALDDVNKQISGMDNLINKLPDTEQRLLRIQREYKLNDATYNYLLQQRAQAQIAKASNMPDCYVIDPANPMISSKVSTKSRVIYLTCLIIGLAIPSSFVYIKEFLYGRIIEKSDVEKITNLSIIGSIYHCTKNDTNTVVLSYPKEPISEIYRTLRTNLNYFLKNSDKKVLLITSSILGEGKTFNAINIASIISMFGHKTILLDFDLRRPKVHHKLNLDNKTGLSSYLSNVATIDEIIKTTQWQNFDVITSGPIPPNPAELISTDSTRLLFDELSELYDYIVMDTPPLSLVTDSTMLMEHADITLFIVRQGVTPLKVFSSLTKEFDRKNIQNVAILINDVKYMFQSYYGYGYKYVYYNYEDKKTRHS